MTTEKCINYSLVVFSFIIVAAVGGVVIATLVLVADQNGMQRYCINIDDGGLIGAFTVDSNDRTMTWDIQHVPTIIGPITSIHIKGPIPSGSLDGPLAVALCGMPAMTLPPCNTMVPGEVSGIIYGQDPLKTTIKEIRTAPWRYYIEFNDGSTTIRGPLGPICGTP